ncbi:hypothetical protein B0H15DRAFT_805266 [Mycena belliarum]|uniref:Uncharacterized protein n=1 Tax=Mycena belliarum TaxID=1033014 RepID=A0AAD6TTZ4_9AGAR|nr:hypothetical protein B0H15DRAFT_805266 [Mycena belliae]
MPSALSPPPWASSWFDDEGSHSTLAAHRSRDAARRASGSGPCRHLSSLTTTDLDEFAPGGMFAQSINILAKFSRCRSLAAAVSTARLARSHGSPERSSPRRRNTLVPNGLVCACERGRNTAAAPPHFGPTGMTYLRCLTSHCPFQRALFLGNLPLQSRVLPARASIRLDPLILSRLSRFHCPAFDSIPKLVNNGLYQATLMSKASPLAAAQRPPGILSKLSLPFRFSPTSGQQRATSLAISEAIGITLTPGASLFGFKAVDGLAPENDRLPLPHKPRSIEVIARRAFSLGISEVSSVTSTIPILRTFKPKALRWPFSRCLASNELMAALWSAAESTLRRNPQISIEIMYSWPYSGLPKLLMISVLWPSSLKLGARLAPFRTSNESRSWVRMPFEVEARRFAAHPCLTSNKYSFDVDSNSLQNQARRFFETANELRVFIDFKRDIVRSCVSRAQGPETPDSGNAPSSNTEGETTRCVREDLEQLPIEDFALEHGRDYARVSRDSYNTKTMVERESALAMGLGWRYHKFLSLTVVQGPHVLHPSDSAHEHSLADLPVYGYYPSVKQSQHPKRAPPPFDVGSDLSISRGADWAGQAQNPLLNSGPHGASSCPKPKLSASPCGRSPPLPQDVPPPALAKRVGAQRRRGIER